MFETKLFEIRDEGTHIDVAAMKTISDAEQDQYLLRRAGYGVDSNLILISRLDGGQCHCDPYCWTNGRTMQIAHEYIAKNFDLHDSGDVIDVEYILGQTVEPKISERFN
jgi:hypothetical protein